MKGIRRTFGTAPARKAPLRSADIRALVGRLDRGTLGGLRDRALLVVGFAGAFRRSELVALDVADRRGVSHTHVWGGGTMAGWRGPVYKESMERT